MTAPDRQTLQVLFNQEPDLAIKYLSDKGLLPSKAWHGILDDAHNRSFVVANLTKIDILSDIKQSLIDAQKNGLTLEQWRKNIVPTLQAKGWWGKDTDGKDMGTPHRMQTIYRTNLQSAYMAGRRAEMLKAVDTHPYWRYVAVMDNRTRPAHRALNGRVMRADDAAWDAIFPPCGWNCRCRVSPMTAGAVERGGYAVESSAGHIETEAVGVGDGTSSATITKLKLPSMDMQFKTDAGFNAAPVVTLEKQLAAKTEALLAPVVKPLQQKPPVVLSEHEILQKAFTPKMAQKPPRRSRGAEAFDHLTIDQQRAISIYTGGSYKKINPPLWKNKASPALKAYTELLNTALDRSPKYTGISTRGLRFNTQEELKAYVNQFEVAFQNDEVIELKGFVSSTKGDYSKFTGNVKLTIESKNGVWVEPLSMHAGENEDEILFKHLSVFRVLKVGYDRQRGIWEIQLIEVE